MLRPYRTRERIDAEGRGASNRTRGGVGIEGPAIRGRARLVLHSTLLSVLGLLATSQFCIGERRAKGRTGFPEAGSLEPETAGLPAAPAPSPARTRVPAAGALGRAPTQSSDLVSGPFLAGRVVDRDGSPVRGAKVNVGADLSSAKAMAALREGNYRLDALLSGVTDREGDFRVTGVPDCPLEIVATLEGHGQARRAGVEPGTDGLVLVLPGPTGVAGVVRDFETGERVERFAVRAEDMEGPSICFPVDPGYPGRNGEFEIHDLAASRWSFQVEAEGYEPEFLAGVEVEPGRIRRDLIVSLRALGAIQGTVVDARTGTPISGAKVQAFQVDSGGCVDAGAPTDKEGRFEVSGVAPGSARVQVSSQGFLDGEKGPLNVPSRGVVRGVTIHLFRGGAIEGRAVRAGSPSFEGGVLKLNSGGRDIRETLGPDGSFHVESLPPGKWGVVARRLASGPEDKEAANGGILRATVLVEEGRTTPVAFEPGSVRGRRVRVRLLRAGKPVPGARLWLEVDPGAEASEGWSLLEEGLKAATSEAGIATFEGVPAGPALLRATPEPGSIWIRPRVEVPEAADAQFEIALPSGEIHGRVFRAEDRAPVEGSIVRIQLATDLEGKAWDAGVDGACSDEEGKFRIRGIPAGAYSVVASPPGEPLCFRTRVPAADWPVAAPVGPMEVSEGTSLDVEIPVVRSGRATVAVVDTAGEPVRKAIVWVGPAEGWRPTPYSWGHSAVPDLHGIARLRGLVPGRHVATASGPRFARRRSDVKEVRSGELTEFRIVLEPGTTVRIAFLDENGVSLPAVESCVRDSYGHVAVARPAPPDFGPSEERGKAIVQVVPGDYILLVDDRPFPLRVGRSSPQEVEIRLGPGTRR